MKKVFLPFVILSVLCVNPVLAQTVSIDRQGNVQNPVVKFDGNGHKLWVGDEEITADAQTNARVPLAHAASHASAGSDALTLAMNQITGLVDALAGKSDTGHTHTFASLTSKPTTIVGYGITDFNALGDARWSLLAHTHTAADVGAPSGSGTSTGTNTGDQVVPANTTATASQYFTAYNSTTGAFTKAQPAFSDVSGSIADGQMSSAITRDSEWDTAAEINAVTTDADFSLSTHTHTGTTISGVDISDDTNLAGTANEITLTGDTLSLHTVVTRDAEWDSLGEIETATGANIIVNTEIDTTTEINALTTDADFSVSTHTHTGTTLSGVDISDDTNLAGTANEITLTGDTLSAHAALTRDTEWDTAAEINTATTDDDFATLTGAQTLASKTLTSPIINNPTINATVSTGSATFAMDTASGSTLSIPINTTATPFSNANNFSGLIMLTSTMDGTSAVFLASGGQCKLIMQSGVNTQFSQTLDNANTTNVYYSSGVITIQNKNSTGLTQTLTVTAIRTRAGS